MCVSWLVKKGLLSLKIALIKKAIYLFLYKRKDKKTNCYSSIIFDNKTAILQFILPNLPNHQ